MAHPGQASEVRGLEELTLFISKEGLAAISNGLKAISVQRDAGEALHLQSAAVPRRQEERHAGLRHSEPYGSRRRPASSRRMFLIADQGFNSYSTLIETRRDLVEKEARLGAAFSVDASIIGWYNYLVWRQPKRQMR